MIFSASQLVKFSCKQICYFRNNKSKEKSSTFSRQKGDDWAEKQLKGIHELQGYHEFSSHRIYFTFDEVRIKRNKTIFIEYKSVQQKENAPEWYLDKSITQLALYGSLLIENYKKIKFKTAKFSISKKQEIQINQRPFIFNLRFGNKKYRISIKNSKKIVEFFENKAKKSLDYQNAAAYDKEFKFNEFSVIKKYIKVKEIKNGRNAIK